MFWQLGWSGISLINYMFCLLGFDSLFNIINILTIFGAAGNIALTSIIYFLYSNRMADYINPDFGDNPDDMKAIFGNIIAGT